ncbi:hypothetical protein GCM10007205_01090 [Oxalicibacterium flavum]|uniref:HTH tetR-type domain-containing protein n=1 Tax=Oxalicibacterium flavum TaxID=179467 RepID=A0A8J2XX43_9BURK|nr:TetR/AcrR family transcriptional regulator [Oxalicibacterium flavum]GGB95635.1 hypothetical protein GCM10007205_01090 [Oxalicibacterium flavum]
MKRIDGINNREALLRAAERLFAEKGFHIPLEEIAEAANVSRTTLYRNFKDRQALGIAIYESQLDDFEIFVENVSEEPDGLFLVLEEMAIAHCHNAGMADVLSNDSSLHPQLMDMRMRVNKLMEPLLQRAKESNLVREEITAHDLDCLLDVIVSVTKRETFEERKTAVLRMLQLFKTGIETRSQ